MNRIILVILLSCNAVLVSAQSGELDIYYPENALYKILKVRSVFDTVAHATKYHYKEEFDSLGRRKAWYYVEEDSIKTVYHYSKIGDTLIRKECMQKNGKDGETYHYEKFLYNNSGKIIFYQTCRTSYEHDGKESYCEVDKLFYDENGILTSKLIYSNSKYPHPFSQDLNVNQSLLTLVDVFSYGFNKANLLILKKEMSGRKEYRTIDSFFYDSKKRLVRSTGHAREGFLGEFKVNNITSTTLIKYESNKKIVSSFETYAQWPPNELKLRDKLEEDYLYYPNGLKQAWFQKMEQSDKSLLEYEIYEFY